jgi:hypothetical protein
VLLGLVEAAGVAAAVALLKAKRPARYRER